MIKNRFGVFTPKKKVEFEKKYHVPYGYDFISFNKGKAILNCKKGQVVERISTDYDKINRTTIIYRWGDDKYEEGKFDDVAVKED